MIFQFLALLLLLLPSISHPNRLNFVNDIVKTMELRCVFMVVQDFEGLESIRRGVLSHLEVQVKVVLVNDLNQMKNLRNMGQCGVFLELQKEESKISNYLEKLLEVNSFDENIFKKLHWFISVTREDSVQRVFKYDSQVYLVIEDSTNMNVETVVETYSIEDEIKVNKVAGNWSAEKGLVLSEKSYLKRRQDLMGKTMKTIYYNDQGYCAVLDPSQDHQNPRNLNWDEHNWSGFVPDIFNAVADKLNFTYTLQFSQDGGWGSVDQNGSWNGGVRDIMDGVADLGGAFFTASFIRSTVVDFTLPLVETINTFFLKNPKAAYSWTSFIKPFNEFTWYILAIMIIICTFSLTILAHLAKEKNIKEFGFEKSFIYSFGAYCALAARRWSVTPLNIAVRIAFITILLCGCLIFWHWKAGLISNLSVVKFEPPFISLEELLQSNLKVALLGGSSYENTFKLSKNPIMKQIWDMKVLPYEKSLFKKKQDGVNLILEDSSFVQFDNYYALKTFPEYIKCDIKDIPNDFTNDRFAFPMAKNGQFREIFNHALKKMVESGEMHKIRAKWATPDQVCEEGKGRTLGFENTLPAFFIFMVGFGLCLCVLAMEIVCSKMGRLNDRQLDGRKNQGNKLQWIETADKVTVNYDDLCIRCKLLQK